MPTLVVRHPDGSESEHELSGELKIGRQEGQNDLVLAEGGVSRRHTRFVVEGGKVMVEDVGSANGTFVDGQRITGMTVITSKSQVLLGDYELRLKAPTGPRSTGVRKQVKPSDEGAAPAEGGGVPMPRSATRAMPAIKRPAPGAGGPSALAKRPRPGSPGAAAGAGAGAEPEGLVLKGLTGPWANKRYPVKGKLVVGRQAPATVVLEDDSVSRKHAEVEQTPDGAVLRDLGSANGTLINGEPTGTEPVVLQPGDIITFGMVEVEVEGSVGASNLPARRGRDVPSRRGTGAEGAPPAEAAPAEGAPASRKRLLVVVASVVGLLLVAGIVKSTQGSGTAGGNSSGKLAPPPPSPTELVQESLSQCRSYASMEGGEPDWVKAEAACSKALDIDPINSEANTLMRRIKLEKESADLYVLGQKALGRLKEEEALDLFKKIPKESAYFRRAKPKVQEAVAQVVKRAEDDCKRYLRDAQWSPAVQTCGRFMGFACQKMSREELEPPIGYTLVLEKNKRLGRTEWRPKHKIYLDFLNARKRVEPNAAPWHCPVSDIFFEDEAAPDPKKLVEETFKQRLPNKFLVAAMMDYWGGRGNEAFATLQKLRSNYELAQYHGEADKLLTAVSNVDQLFKIGQGHLQNEDVEKAADPLMEALEVDKRLMGDLADTRPSFYKRNIQQDMAAKAITRGRFWDDRGDQRRACRIWKLGFRFYAGNTDLNFQVGRCSTRGLKALKTAGSCAELDAVLDLAVPGDGLEEKVAALKKENNC